MTNDIETRIEAALHKMASSIRSSRPTLELVNQVRVRRWLPPIVASIVVATIAAIVAIVATTTRPPHPGSAAAKTSLSAITPPPTVGPTQTTNPFCSSGALSAHFTGTGREAGSEFGVVTISNASKVLCRLAGRVEVTPLDRAGKHLAFNSTWRNSGDLQATLLSPISQHLGATDVTVILGGEYRDDPLSETGLCSPSNEITPVSWSITISSVVIVVPNYDPHSPLVRAISGCRGAFANVLISAHNT